jgi:ATP-dependent Lon protease
MASRGTGRTKEKPPARPLPARPVLAIRDAVHFPGAINTVHVVRDASLRAVRKALNEDQTVIVLSQRDMSVEDPAPGDLFQIGTLSEILQSIPLPDGSLRVALRSLARVRAKKVETVGGAFQTSVQPLVEIPAEDTEGEALGRACVASFTRIVELNPEVPPESLQGLAQADDGGALADAILHHLPIRSPEKQEMLERLDHRERLEGTLALLKREEKVLQVGHQISRRVDRAIGEGQRELYLREQLRAIQEELRESGEEPSEVDEYRQKLEQANLPDAAREHAEAEIRKLERTPAASPEGMVLRNYLDTLVSLPWNHETEDRLDVNAAQRLLDEQHYGLDKVKDRILDHLAVRQLRGSLRGPILCFVGPPGVGKTSIGRSIAEAMGRQFVRISLGGVRDEAEIRGHRRTYVGSMPGRILAGLRTCGSRNPVVILDEIDKLASGVQGDPTSALLEALDPEQNRRFSDHYVEVPFDLSHVLFVATANLLENVPPALRDRMEVIPFASYTQAERREIAARFLVPRAREEHGFGEHQLEFPSASLDTLVADYTREAGVRDLGRQIDALCRKAARQVAQGLTERVVLDGECLGRFLGRPKFRRSPLDIRAQVGCANAMVVSEAGGDIVTVEVSLTQPLGERPELILTGNLGAVMRESAQAALTAVRAALEGSADCRRDVHIHVPEAAVPKDGPSAGLPLAVALASAFLGRAVRGDVAMTGEITLRGRILPVGGVPEKILAASRAGLTSVFLPAENEPDLDEVPPEVLATLKLEPVERLGDALELALLPPSAQPTPKSP